MKDFIKRLSSRKFLIVVVLIVAITLFPGIPDAVVVLGLSYVGAEGLVDVVRAYKQATVDTARVEKDIALINAGEIPAGDGEKGKITPGTSF